jgi:hypothetical protein
LANPAMVSAPPPPTLPTPDSNEKDLDAAAAAAAPAGVDGEGESDHARFAPVLSKADVAPKASLVLELELPPKRPSPPPPPPPPPNDDASAACSCLTWAMRSDLDIVRSVRSSNMRVLVPRSKDETLTAGDGIG